MELLAAIADRVARDPAAVAFEGPDGKRLDYGGLDARADALAAGLRAHGVGPGRRVALMLPRSTDLFTAELAVLRAGACYAPLDPDQPPERLARLLRAADSALVLTEDPRRSEDAGLAAAAGVRAVSVPELAAEPAGCAPEPEVGPQDPACCLFTSGSTGFPTGVLISRAALDAYTASYAGLVGCRPGERGAQLGSPGFDVTIDEIWPFLTTGATVVIAPDTAQAGPERLAEWLRAARVTTTYIPPLLLEAMFRTRPPLGELRLVRTGGERLAAYPPPGFPCRVLNEYGPTETVAGATTCDVSAWRERGVLPPIGRPLPHITPSIRDERGAVVPRGEAGELYLSGPTVSLGYLGDPERTAEKFVQLDGARWFRTGDLVRELPTGDLEFLRRADDQVQLLGKRVDLGEVEQAVRAHPAVRRTAVVAPQDRFGRSDGLHCFVRWEPGADVDAPRLRAHLAAQLPAHLVPTAVHDVDDFPVTPAGKVDRRALLRRLAAARDRPEIELAGMVRLWEQVLGAAGLAPDDDFFRLGGTSALAVQLAADAQQRWHRPVSARDVFTNPTPRALAGVLNGADRRQEER